ncbi:MAG: tRNA pseudouridine(65) synthase TruC [Bdellovibrio sp.]|nr:tRNA pseudouridine(65) synthase TruC [Bdellovibrio sp.]
MIHEITEFPVIQYQDDEILILYKPPTWFVHPPENKRFRRGLKRRTCVQWLADHHQIRAFPAHRIDAGTNGILIFGKTKESTAHLNLQFKNHEVDKTYHAVVRGWMKEKEGVIQLPLELDSTGELVECETYYKSLGQIELPFSVTPKFQTTRYSWLEVKPKTGRWHQIRRHMNRVAHPIIGDREHGDSHHNRFFREQLKVDGLCLSAIRLEFIHPGTLKKVVFKSMVADKWQHLNEIFKLGLFQAELKQ